MSEIRFYHSVPSRGMMVHWMLEELSEPYTTVMLDMDKEEHKQASYLAINPLGKVPALVHRGKIITETAAICTYLADAFPAKNLDIAQSSELRGEYLRWLFFAPVTAEPALGWAMLGKAAADMAYQPFADIDSVAATLRDALKGKSFIVGDKFTAADVLVGSVIHWGINMMQIMPAHPELLAYWQALEQRPAWQRAQAKDNAYLAGKNT